MQRVAVYIDGFNLTYGLIDKGWQRYEWLDVRQLSQNLLRSDQRLVLARYFTARMYPNPNNPGKSRRQDSFLDAIATLPDVYIHYGYHMRKKASCAECGATTWTYEEKMTDVNIAAELLGDAQDNAFDTAIIVSADSDLVGPVNAVLNRYPSKRMIIAFPPKRASKHLKKVATGYFTIGRKKFEDSQLPNQITKPDGYVLTRPSTWN